MKQDLTLPADGGYLNVRVGAIIRRGGRVLMVANDRVDYLYSVGGRVRFGETTEEAVVREVLEETGVRMEIDRLGIVQEQYFRDDGFARRGALIYELAFYYYMKTPPDFAPVCRSRAEDGQRERLVWLDPQEARRYEPAFLRTALDRPGIVHLVTDGRRAETEDGP